MTHQSSWAYGTLLFLLAACRSRQPAGADASFVDATADATAPTARFDRQYVGRVGSADATMHLIREGDALSGTYSYRAIGVPIRLTGKVNSDASFSLTEMANEKVTGEFHGNLASDGFIRGTWSDPSGRRSLPFSFRESSGDLAMADAGTGSPCRRVATSAVSRYGCSGTVLDDGRVLLVGSAIHDSGGPYSAVVEAFDPATHALVKLAPLHVARARHTDVRLLDGRVLIVSGEAETPRDTFSRSTEVFEPRANRWSQAGDVPEGALGVALTTLPDGRVMAAGGDLVYKAKKLAQTLVFDPNTMRWTRWPDAPRERVGDLFQFTDGRVAFVGNTLDWYNQESPIVDVFEARSGTWSSLPPLGMIVEGMDRLSPSSIALFGHDDVDGGGGASRVRVVDDSLAHPRDVPLANGASPFVLDGALYATHEQTISRWDAARGAWSVVASFLADGCATFVPIPARAGARGRVLFAGTCDKSTHGALELCEL